jgi:hypothetical protein
MMMMIIKTIKMITMMMNPSRTFFSKQNAFPAYLATSPIISNEDLMKEGVARLRAKSKEQDALQEQQRHHEAALRAEQGGELTLNLSGLVKDLKSDSSLEEDKKRGKPRRKV